MMPLTFESLIQGADTALRNLSTASSRGLNPVQKYLSIQEAFARSDPSTDENFQRKFVGYYRVRRNEGWRRSYFHIFGTQKALHPEDVSFANVLEDILRATGRYEASFASKLVATINPHAPVIDSVVLNQVGLSIPKPNAENRTVAFNTLYDDLENALKMVLDHQSWPQVEAQFDRLFPEACAVPRMKKLDLLVWQLR